ncbi:MAG: TIGR03905 family TSCPD domain-containing protein [Clostridia bacterium]|nr:TIGR03905 family TSCPD domain-containing protein [Clostridia bacterium]
MIKKGTYTTRGVCSRKIDYEIEDGIVKNIEFTGGCNGNLSGISRLVKGMPIEKVVELLEGTTCGYKETSCPDQLAQALKQEL